VKQRRKGEKLEVRERPDRWAPLVSQRKKKEKGKRESWAGSSA
jgi:hypothetical protein